MLDAASLKKLSLTVAMLSVDGVQKANSGHPGLPMGAAGYTSLLWSSYLRFNPKEPRWIGRDRFVLSAGHGSMLLYSLLHLFGYDLPMKEIQSFRQWGSKTPGHPEYGMTPGVECTTGPLGQGFGNGVGLALSGKMLGEAFDKELFAYRVFGVVSDGDLMEGIASEAASLAGHLGLDNLVYLYDDNKISLAGKTDECFTESVPDRFAAYGWFVQSVNANDLNAVAACIEKAIAEPSRPSIICVRSVIGEGSPNKANTHDVHGSPLGDKEVAATKEHLGWPVDPHFYIPEDTKQLCSEVIKKNIASYDAWNTKYNGWRSQNQAKAAQLDAQVHRELPAALRDELAQGLGHSKKEATRNLSAKAIQIMAKHLPYLVGGSADLEPSTKTLIKESSDVQRGSFKGRNVRYGVREHAMGAAVNGLAYERLWIPFCSTFLVFSDYVRPSIRLAALSHLQSLFVFTHDSFWVGEDGPTHEPIEHIQALRIIPNLYTFRPADGIEVGMSYWAALELKQRPSALLFTRQDLPPIARKEGFSVDDVLRGAYVVQESSKDTITIVATGSEVHLAIDAAKKLQERGIHARIVSMPCVELFLEQPASVRAAVLPSELPIVSIEAGRTLGWERIVGSSGLSIGIDHYGASAPGELLAEKFGFTPEAVVEKIVPWLR